MTYEEYKVIAAGQAQLEAEFGDIAYKIAEKLTGGKCNRILSFGESQVFYEYNGSCGCHPTNDVDDFPSEWLFDPLWEEKWNARKTAAQKQAEIDEKEIAEKAKRAAEAAERKQLDVLKKKYEEKPTERST